MDGIIERSTEGFKNWRRNIKFEGDNIESNNIQSVFVQEIKEKLYGKEVKAKGSIMFCEVNCGCFLVNYSFIHQTSLNTRHISIDKSGGFQIECLLMLSLR